jgi:hypothetical protein
MLFFIACSGRAQAQQTWEWGVLPSLNFNKKLPKDWSINAKLEGRYLLASGDFNQEVFERNRYLLTDVALVAAKKIGLNSRVAGGFLARFEDGVFIQRSIQQFVVVRRLPGFRLAHRIVTDQTFSPDEATEFRLRYRISTEIPLNGESLDQKEFYLKINHEYLHSFQDAVFDLEIRMIPLLGYGLSENIKLESGLDYRLSALITGSPEHTFWMTFNLFVEF